MKYLFSILIVLFSFGGFAQDSKKIKNDSLLTSLDSLDINPDSVKQKIIGLIIKSDFLLPANASIGYNFGYSVTIEKLIKKRMEKAENQIKKMPKIIRKVDEIIIYKSPEA